MNTSPHEEKLTLVLFPLKMQILKSDQKQRVSFCRTLFQQILRSEISAPWLNAISKLWDMLRLSKLDVTFVVCHVH